MDPPPPRPAAVPLSHARTTRRGHGLLGKDEAPFARRRLGTDVCLGVKITELYRGKDHEATYVRADARGQGRCPRTVARSQVPEGYTKSPRRRARSKI